jgi:hypothetical protein
MRLLTLMVLCVGVLRAGHSASVRTCLPNACLADPEGVRMYATLEAGGSGRMPKFLCYRGTSQLEGFHAHLYHALAGTNYAPDLAQQ